MSENIKKTKKTVETIASYTCDRCKKVIEIDDVFEVQEMLHVRLRGGFSSVFGDLTTITGDFCQDCVKEVLGPFLVVKDD